MPVKLTDQISDQRGSIQRIAIIGAGRLGRAFAYLCAARGLDVVLEDVLPSNLREAQAGFAELAAAQSIQNKISFAASIEEAVREADLVIDFVPDELESKLEIFSLVDRMAPPKTILCTPSDALSITDLASCTYRADRCVAVQTGDGGKTLTEATQVRVLHSSKTSPQTLAVVSEFWRALGKEPLLLADPAEPMLTRNIEAGNRSR